jgi:SNF2 family DNA or RNA helicase
MIELKLVNNEIRLFFGGENFQDILDCVKTYYLKFNKDGKYCTGSNQSFYNLIPNLLQIEEFEISEKILEMIKPRIQVKFQRREFNKDFFKSEPLGNYQLEDTKKMLFSNGIINGSDCGLGKTIETISVINHLYDNQEIDKILIVCFAQVCYNWKREFLLYSDFFKEEDIVIANKDNRNPFETDPKIIICSYNTLNLILKNFNKKISKKSRRIKNPFKTWGNNRCIILDEAHSIKGDSLRTKMCLLISDQFKFKYLLTGTPYPNNIAEIYQLLNFIDINIIYNDKKHFLFSLSKNIDHWGNIIEYDEEKVKEFLEKIKSFIFRRYKKEALPNLVQQYNKKIYIEMNKKQLEIYQLIITSTLQSLKEEKGQLLVRDVMNRFPYLTLVCSDPSILDGKLISKIEKNNLFNEIDIEIESKLSQWNFYDNSKLEVLTDIIEENEDKKIIIWCSHPRTIDNLGIYYKKYNPITIHGKSHEKTKEDKEIYRDKLLYEFKNTNRKIIIMNPGIMGTGVNIQEAEISIFFDRSYDIKEYLQALARNHRGNSTKDVTNYLLLLDNTLEIRQNAILEGKEYLNNNLLKYETLPKEEWLKIFNGKIE